MSLKNELRTSADLLSQRSKILAGIGGHTHKLSTVLQTLTEARATVEIAQGDAAIGEASAADVAKAQKAVTSVEGDVREISTTLAGLRRRAAEMAPALHAAHKRLAGELPDYHAELKASFAKEWAEGIAAYERLLGRRVGLEGLLGEAFVLPAPKAAVVDIGAAAEPKQRLGALSDAISAVGSSAPVSPDPRNMMAHYNDKEIYRSVIAFSDGNGSSIDPGGLLCDATLGGDWVRHLVQLRDALPLMASEFERAHSEAHTFSLAQPAASVPTGPTANVLQSAPVGRMV